MPQGASMTDTISLERLCGSGLLISTAVGSGKCGLTMGVPFGSQPDCAMD